MKENFHYKNKNYVLHLASWYPGKKSKYTASFIKNQVKALSEIKYSVLITIIEDSEIEKIEVEKIQNVNLLEVLVYIPYKGNVLRWIYYFIYYWKFIKRNFLELGLPDIVHVHVAYKASVLAYFIRIFYHIPYIITEHFSVFNPSSTLFQKSFIIKYSNFFSKEAYKIIAVSKPLADSLIKHNFKNVKIISNPVNIEVFKFKATKREEIKRFLHISNLNEPQKNVRGIIAAFKIFNCNIPKTELKIIGSNSTELVRLRALVLSEFPDLPITFSQGLNHFELANEMNLADVLVMFSNYETFSLVVAEALCCGLPCLASVSGGPEELINESNGILVQKGNINELATGMSNIINFRYDREMISLEASKKYLTLQFKNNYQQIYSDILA